MPKDRAQKWDVVKSLFEDTIPVTPRKSKLLSAWSNIYLPKPKVKGRKAFWVMKVRKNWIRFSVEMTLASPLRVKITKSVLGRRSMEIASTKSRNIYVDILRTCCSSTNRRWWGAIVHYIFNPVMLCEPKKRICW